MPRCDRHLRSRVTVIDDETIRRALAGDSEAFDDLIAFAEYHLGRRRRLQAADIDDVAGDSVSDMLGKAAPPDGPGYSVIFVRALERHGKRAYRAAVLARRVAATGAVEECGSSGDDPLEFLIAWETAQDLLDHIALAVGHAMNALGDHDYELIRTYYDLPIAPRERRDPARERSESFAARRRAIHRARRKFRTMLSARLREFAASGRIDRDAAELALEYLSGRRSPANDSTDEGGPCAIRT